MTRAFACACLAACSTPEHDVAASASAIAASVEAAPAAPASAGVVPAVPMPSAAPVASVTPTLGASMPAARIAARPASSSGAPSVTAYVPSSPSAGAHFCFSWRTGHESSNPCYASLASCNAERRALAQTEELTRCLERKGAFCTRVAPGGDLAEGRHCFGDAARCMAFRAETAGHASTSPCAPD